ncbi:MAG: C-GCAxxG-C-C family (seleno)protein [Candidatus Hodarchaeota archaeon]
MKDQEVIDDIFERAYKRMHRYTCAEATLQAFLELWDIPVEDHAWATGGYLGAITSSHTTCGLLIGTSIAIGIHVGRDKKGIPEQFPKERDKATRLVNRLYRRFLKKFGTTDCNKITNGFIGEDWGKNCDACFDHVKYMMLELIEKGKI